MSKQGLEWRVIATPRTKGRLIHISGIASGVRPFPSGLHIEVAGSAPQRIFGTFTCHPQGNRAAAGEILFGIMGALDAPAAGSSWTLVLEWEGRPSQRVALQASAPSCLGVLRRYLHTTASLVRRRQFAVIRAEIERVLQSALSARRDPVSVLAWFRRGSPKLALVVDHSLGGGSGAYSTQLSSGLLADGYAVLRLIPDHATFGYQIVAQRRLKTRAAFVPDLGQLSGLLRGVRFARTFFNNALTFPDTTDLVAILGRWMASGALGELVFLIHDFYSVCPSWVLIDSSGKHCGVPDVEACARCLPSNRIPFASLAGGLDVVAWRALWAPLLHGAREVRCFSASSRELLRRAYPQLRADRLTVVPHAPHPAPLREIGLRDPGAPVLGIVGAISMPKGAEILRDLSYHLRDTKSPVRMVVIGRTECDLAPGVTTVTGRYRREDLPALLEANGVNVAFLPSVWPETYSYVTDELMEMGLPLLVFDVGAPPERVARYPRGLVIPVSGPATILDAVTRLYRQHVRSHPATL